MRIKFALICAALLLVGCSPKYLPPSSEITIERRDSIVYRDSLIYTPIPLGRHEVITSTADTSRVETQVAFSIAYVDSVGRLHHGIENKPISLPHLISIPSRFVWMKVEAKKTQQLKPQVIQVEKPLSRWQSFKIAAFWYLLAAVLVLLVWAFRKPILKLLKP